MSHSKRGRSEKRIIGQGGKRRESLTSGREKGGGRGGGTGHNPYKRGLRRRFFGGVEGERGRGDFQSVVTWGEKKEERKK